MRVEEKVQKEIYLIMTPDEASWLKAAMQNPLFCNTPESEDSFEREMRLNVFDSLSWSS